MIRKFSMLISVAMISCSPSVEGQNEILSVEKATGIELCSSQKIREINKKFLSNLIEDELSGQDLHSSKIQSVNQRDLIVRQFDTNENHCMAVSEFSPVYSPFQPVPRFRRYGFVTLQGRVVPVAVSWRKDAKFNDEDPVEQIILRVPGGPGGVEIAPAMDQITPIYGNALIVDLFYTGHGFNILHPTPSFDVAVQQIVSLLDKLRTRNKRAEIILMGESLGAVLSLAALEASTKSAKKEFNVDRLIILAPPFASLKETASILRKINPSLSVEGGKFLYRVRGQGEPYNAYGSLQMLDDFDVFERFASEAEKSKTLRDRINLAGGLPPTLLIFGGRDERISLNLSIEFLHEKPKEIQILRIDEMGHNFNDAKQGRTIFSTIDDFILN